MRKIGRVVTNNPKVVLGTTLGLTVSGITYQTVFKFKKDIIVKEKYVKHENNEPMYMITDEKNVIYKFENSIWRLHWKRAEQWNTVDKGKTYHVEGVGIRSPFFGYYPRIYSVKEID